MKLDIADGAVNVTKCIGILLKCVELSAELYSSRPIRSFVKDDSEPCHLAMHTGHQQEVLEQHQDADLALPITGYESD